MNLILLGGTSVENKKWIEDVENLFKPLFKTTKIIYYDNWQTGQWMINLDKEKEKLIKVTKNLDKYVIFAKSAGSIVAIKAIFENKIFPQNCLFVGIPLKWAKKNNFNIDNWFRGFSVPTVILQHTSDPFGSSKEIKDLISNKDITNVELKEIPGNTHDYNEFDFIFNLLDNFHL